MEAITGGNQKSPEMGAGRRELPGAGLVSPLPGPRSRGQRQVPGTAGQHLEPKQVAGRHVYIFVPIHGIVEYSPSPLL